MSKVSLLRAEQIELDTRLGNLYQVALEMGNKGGRDIWMGLYKQARLEIEQARQIMNRSAPREDWCITF